MAQISPPLQPFAGRNTLDSLDLGPHCHNRPISTQPEPNPPFVFPMQVEPIDEVQQPQAATAGHNALPSTAAASNRRTINRARPQRLSINALPAFQFHPSASVNTSPGVEVVTPSPTKSIPNNSRPGGHRRGGSEFIGGDGKVDGPGLMSISPTKGEGSLPPPSTTPKLGPPTPRRGHAHRRSGAVSSQDLSMILKPSHENLTMRAGSAPSTPSDPNRRFGFQPDTNRSNWQSDLRPPGHRTTVSFDCRENAPTPPQPRVVRVGFSDTIEFIPRPLSTISSETSSSMSTIRANHSVTGSTSSILSGGTSSPPSARRGRHSMDASVEYHTTEIRQSTTDSTMSGLRLDPGHDENSGRPVDSTSAFVLPSKCAEAAGSSGSTRQRSFIGNDRRAGGMPIQKVPETGRPEPSYPVLPPENPEIQRTISRQASTHDGSSRSRSKAGSEPKIAKRQRKVKTWAGSILSRKGRHPSPKEKAMNRRSPTPPLRNYSSTTDFNLEDVTFDEDTTCVIHTPLEEHPQPARIQSDYMTWKPRQSSPDLDPDALSPMLDLDAALGPFNTPTVGREPDSPHTARVSYARRRMYGSGAAEGFTGFGMDYHHRRAESAPEMPPVKIRIPRLSSNTTMDDVFEEEEEEYDECPSTTLVTPSATGESAPHGADGVSGLGLQLVDFDRSDDWSANQRGLKRKGSGLSEGERRQSSSGVKQQKSASSLKSEVIAEENGPVEIVQADEEPRTSVNTKSSDETIIGPMLSNDCRINRPASPPMDLGLPRPSFYYVTPETPSSMVSSPDFSGNSFDVPRLGTATSSITDRATVSSSRAGELGPDLRVSVDDVPSLTSSASTMMSAYPAPRLGLSSDARLSAERPSSMTATVPARTRQSAGKRSSLASLSRLVGGSYGEKSKLSIEERAQTDCVEKADKRKGSRLSRLMHFWKPKEKQSS
ncbi:MAG: hypothetical protein FRX48_09352 [Lasallia pustulata]|uniref:Cell wall proline rich protein n=1 Tax=Lasallia pustulata TaxID=136370 RepID=A0A5M8PD55_9LECA|nr:MAG: hypothetical protein FRX48_09352 [Lasallia pustulata]